MKNKINLYKLYCLSFLLLTAGLLSAQYTETIEESFPAKSEVTILHRRGPVKVIKATDGKVSFQATIRFDAASEAEAQKLKKALIVKGNDTGSRIDITSSSDIKNMKTINGKSTIELKDGTKIKGIKKLEIALVVKVPELKKLRVESRYHEVEVDAQVSEMLLLQTYNSELKIADISGDLQLNDKYSKGTVGAFRNAQMELYESKIEFGKGREVEVNAKYSTLRFPGLDALAAQSYENKVYVGNVKGKIEINDKYSKFEFEDIQDALMDLYETDITANTIQKAQIKSKYADLRFTAANDIYFATSYEDELQVNDLGTLRAGASKYTEYKIVNLNGALELDSYEDDIEIENPASTIKTIRIKGKYTNLNCPFPSSMRFKMDMVGKYGSIDLDEDDLNYSTYIKKGSELKLVGTRNNATDTDANFAFDCYECKIRLKN
ncbi:MAG: hypothetical protein Sapg2KO_12210 [Saprospiraceae bacterium]